MKTLLQFLNQTKFLTTITIVFLLVQGCTEVSKEISETDSKPAFDLAVMKQTIHEKTNQFMAAHISKDTTLLNNMFTEDAKIFPPNSNVVEGKAAIAALNAAWVDFGIHEAREVSVTFYGSGDYLIDDGIYLMRFGKDNTVETGTYINIWKQENGEWKLYRNIWNSDK
jgi:ketosteroid isomerase-like protein